jgi:hypothetical protein
MIRSMSGSAANLAATCVPRNRLTPVISTTLATLLDAVGLLLVASLDARLLQQLAVLLLGHPLAPLLDDRTHEPDLDRR